VSRPLVTVRRQGWRTFERPKVLNAAERGDHGTTAAYAVGCHCERCTNAARASERARRAELAVLNGRQPRYRVDTAAISGHVAALRAAGWTLRAIAVTAGLNVEAFRRCLRVGRTDARTVAKVHAVR
jgi:hypothetical protein